MKLKSENFDIERFDPGVVDQMRHGRNISFTLGANTLSSYQVAARQYDEFLKKRGLKANENSLIAFFKENKHWFQATLNLKRQALMKVFQYQDEIRSDYLKVAAVREIFKAKIPRAKSVDRAIRHGQYLTEDQVDHLVRIASNRIGLMIRFAFMTGCRVSEMIGIRNIDVSMSDLDECKIRILGKGSKQRIVYVLKSMLEEIRQVFNGYVFLFETKSNEQYKRKYIWREIRKVGMICDLKVYPHIFRHSFAMHLVKNNLSPDYVQKALGHADVSTTIKYYYHNLPDESIVHYFLGDKKQVKPTQEK